MGLKGTLMKGTGFRLYIKPEIPSYTKRYIKLKNLQYQTIYNLKIPSQLYPAGNGAMPKLTNVRH